MQISFSKYQGTGNDFILLDNRNGEFDSISSELIGKLCDRRFGIGADGLIWVREHDKCDFEIRYFNSDGSRSFCGNGARCAVKFAHSLGLFDSECRFEAIDGEHYAKLNRGLVELQMSDVQEIETDGEAFVLDTGSPHYIEFTEDLSAVDIVEKGKKVRYNSTYQVKGINVNVAEEKSGYISMLTYERGVEDETPSCGTGATAVALAHALKHNIEGLAIINIKVKGGDLSVRFNRKDEKFTAVFLVGPGELVYKGEINV